MNAALFSLCPKWAHVASRTRGRFESKGHCLGTPDTSIKLKWTKQFIVYNKRFSVLRERDSIFFLAVSALMLWVTLFAGPLQVRSRRSYSHPCRFWSLFSPLVVLRPEGIQIKNSLGIMPRRYCYTPREFAARSSTFEMKGIHLLGIVRPPTSGGKLIW